MPPISWITLQLLFIKIQFVRLIILSNKSIKLHHQNSLSNKLLKRISPIQTINTIGPYHPILKLNQLLMRTRWCISTNKQPCLLYCKISQSLYLLHKRPLVPFQLKFHIYLTIMDPVLLSQIVLVYHSHSIVVLFG